MMEKNKTILIKIGGSILQDEEHIVSLAKDIKDIVQAGYKIVLVHGGSKAINEALTVYGIKTEFKQGMRVTSSAAMKIIEMVLCGQVNQLLVRTLNKIAVAAIGLSGAENQMLLCDYYSQQHEFVGCIKSGDVQFIQLLLEHDKIPVIATIGVDEQGNALNINADMAAAFLANALSVDQVVFLTDQDGIYNYEGKIFPQISAKNLQNLINLSMINAGMLVKAQAIIGALNAGLDQIQIINGKQQHALLDAVLYQKHIGTLCLQHLIPVNSLPTGEHHEPQH